MNSKYIAVSVVACIGLVSVFSAGCGPLFEPCPNQVDCGGGNCAPQGSVCCSETTYCSAGETCAGNSCIGGGGGGGCLASGEQTCYNTDGTTDCAPLLSSCCHDHTYCAYPYPVCGGGKCYQ